MKEEENLYELEKSYSRILSWQNDCNGFFQGMVERKEEIFSRTFTGVLLEFWTSGMMFVEVPIFNTFSGNDFQSYIHIDLWTSNHFFIINLWP